VPVYEYRCSKGHEFELHQSFSAPTQQKCINCSARARRMISNPAVIFKGSGFYSTDNRRSSGALSNGPSSDSSSSESSPVAESASKSDNGNGHSHGPGGHSHDKPAKASKIAAAD
jgi:putative FmdB family regulatory protein